MADGPVWELLLPFSAQGSEHRRIVRAQGHRLLFADGAAVLDATSGLWNANLGYGNETIARAVYEALTDASYLTLFRYHHDYARRAADALIDVARPWDYERVLFTTSGSAANDATMKLVRQYAVLRGEPDRRLVVGMVGSYHGQTYGAFVLSGDDFDQAMYGADQRLVRHVDHRDPAELSKLLDDVGNQVAAVVVEPVIGTGAFPLGTEMTRALFELRREHGFLLVCDEVATGFGRTGPVFASSAWAEPPDVLLTSKGLTNGTCGAAAVLVGPDVCAEFERTDAVLIHGETQAGTPASCAAILATLQQFEELNALETGRRNAGRIEDGLRAIVQRSPMASDATGLGCFWALHLRWPDGEELSGAEVTAVIEAVRARGVLVHGGPSAIQLVPALTFTDEEITEVLDAVEAGLGDYAAASRTTTAQ